MKEVFNHFEIISTLMDNLILTKFYLIDSFFIMNLMKAVFIAFI